MSKTAREVEFQVRINGGPEQTIRAQTGIYCLAAMAIPAMLGIDLPVDVEIWIPWNLPEYGPYRFRIEYNEFVQPVVKTMVPA